MSPAARNLDTAGQKMVGSRISRMTQTVELELKSACYLGVELLVRLEELRLHVELWEAEEQEGLGAGQAQPTSFAPWTGRPS
jgi:hypothetical protein